VFAEPHKVMGLNLKKNVIWSSFGHLVYALCQWVTIIGLAKIAGPKAVGVFALGVAVTGPIIMLSNLSLRQALIIEKDEDFILEGYLFIRSITVIIAFLLILFVGNIIYVGEKRNVLILIGFVKSIEAICDILYGFFQRKNRLDLVSISMIIRGGCGVIAFLISFYVYEDIVTSCLFLVATSFFSLLIWDIPQFVSLYGIQFLKQLFGFSEIGERAISAIKIILTTYPLGLSATLLSLNVNVPRYFIEHYVGEEGLGVFVSLGYFVVVGGVVISAIWQASARNLNLYFINKDIEKFRCLLRRLFLFSLLLGVVGVAMAVLWGEKILIIFYGDAFSVYYNFLIFIMVIATFTYLAAFLGSALISMNLFSQRLFLILVSVVINIVVCVIFVPQFELLGGAFGWLSSVIVYFLLSYYLISKFVKLDFFSIR